jgi:hypothetical protein
MFSQERCRGQATYKVVKFIVKVKLMEKSVNSHVGRVYVTQYKTVGSTLKMERMTRSKRPKLVDGVVSAGFMPSTEFDRVSAVLYTAALETCASDRDVALPGNAMVAMVGEEGSVPNSDCHESMFPDGSRVANPVWERQESHDAPFCGHVEIRGYALGNTCMWGASL